MSAQPPTAISVPVDCTNPGQFFACCGLLETAHRLQPGAEGWFEGGYFTLRFAKALSLQELLVSFKNCPMVADGGIAGSAGGEEEDANEGGKAPPITLAFDPPLRLDWWAERGLKTWAGSMDSTVIFRAMRDAIDETSPDPLNCMQVVYERVPAAAGDAPRKRCRKPKPGKKREPFYFDARRGASARSLDIGFAPDALKLETQAAPALEALCLVGLQRFRPMPTNARRVFHYFTWNQPLSAPIAAVAACGLLPRVGGKGYRFENAFRTEKHKAFTPATPFERSAP